ncbi:MAG: hypothetical protein EpisKO_17670 [Epibacterium sp.]
MSEKDQRRPSGLRGAEFLGVATALILAVLAGQGQARLPHDTGFAALHGPGATPLSRDRRAVKAPMPQMSPLSWRCQLVCDETGHVRQSCLMLADPRLSGIGQRLDYLSKTKSALKSLGDLGLSDLIETPTC